MADAEEAAGVSSGSDPHSEDEAGHAAAGGAASGLRQPSRSRAPHAHAHALSAAAAAALSGGVGAVLAEFEAQRLRLVVRVAAADALVAEKEAKAASLQVRARREAESLKCWREGTGGSHPPYPVLNTLQEHTLSCLVGCTPILTQVAQ
jgi:hypothetical protein